MAEGTVALEGMEFYAYHGYYEEERKVGNHYTVDVEIKTDFSKAADSDELEGTVNYEEVYRLVEKEMKISTKLLEAVGQKIINSIFENIPGAHKVKVGVSKHNPPIGGVCAKSKVTLTQEKQ